MNHFLLLLILLAFVGCSSSKKKGEVGFSDDIEKEFEGLENADFLQPEPVNYSEQADSFPEKIEEKDSLIKESVMRLPRPKLEDVADMDDPINKIVGHCYLRDFAKAREFSDAHYRKYRKNPSFWNQIGTCALLEGQYKKAQLYYNKSRDLNKKFVPPINNLGVLYQLRGQDQKALQAYEKATKLKGFSSTPYFNLAQLYLQYGFADKARTIFMGLLRSKPEDNDLLNGVGVSYLLKGDYGTAISYFDKINSDFLKRPDININYALTLKLAGKTEDARDLIGKVDDKTLPAFREYYDRVNRFIGE